MEEEKCWIILADLLGLTYYGLLQERSFTVACCITTSWQASVTLEPCTTIFSPAMYEFVKCLLLCWNRLRYVTTLLRKNTQNTQVLWRFYTLQLAWPVSNLNALKWCSTSMQLLHEYLSVSSEGNFNKKPPNQPRVVPHTVPLLKIFTSHL